MCRVLVVAILTLTRLKEPDMTDLSDFIPSSDTLVITLKNPATEEPLKNEDGTEQTIEVHSQSSGLSKHAFRQALGLKLKSLKEEDSDKEKTEEEIFAENYDLTSETSVEYLAKITKGWNITYGGEKPKFTFEKAREIYGKVVFLRDQLELGLAEDRVFTKA